MRILSFKWYGFANRFVVDEDTGMTEERRKKIAVFLPRFKELVETLKRIHVAVFYFTGTRSRSYFRLSIFNE